MKDWLDERGFIPRPVVFIDDHGKHHEELCAALTEKFGKESDERLSRCTLVILDKPGPGTQELVVELLESYPTIQIVAGPFDVEFRRTLSVMDSWLAGSDGLIDDRFKDILGQAKRSRRSLNLATRFKDFSRNANESEREFGQFVSTLIRPGGFLVCDVGLEECIFTRDSTENAHLKGVRAASIACKRQEDKSSGTESTRLIVVSNQNMFRFDVERQFKEFGIDVDAEDLRTKPANYEELINLIGHEACRLFPWRLIRRALPSGDLTTHMVGVKDKKYVNGRIDLCLWPISSTQRELAGRSVRRQSHVLDVTNNRTVVLQRLIHDHVYGLPGIAPNEFERLISPESKDVDPAQFKYNLRRCFLEEEQKIIPHGSGNVILPSPYEAVFIAD